MNDWQKVSKLHRGFKPGDLRIIAMQRQTGKSTMVNAYLNAWGKWEPVWSWRQRKSISGKMIRGRIAQRRHLLALSDGGSKSWTQYATKKEAFLEALNNG